MGIRLGCRPLQPRIIVARFGTATFGCVTSNVRERATLLARGARFRRPFFDLFLESVSTVAAFPPDFLEHYLLPMDVGCMSNDHLVPRTLPDIYRNASDIESKPGIASCRQRRKHAHGTSAVERAGCPVTSFLTIAGFCLSRFPASRTTKIIIRMISCLTLPPLAKGPDR